MLSNEYLCDCESCLNLEFSLYQLPVSSVGEMVEDFLEECLVDDDDDRESRVDEFVSTLCESAFVQC